MKTFDLVKNLLLSAAFTLSAGCVSMKPDAASGEQGPQQGRVVTVSSGASYNVSIYSSTGHATMKGDRFLSMRTYIFKGKTLTIEGDVPLYTRFRMESGSLLVKGNVGDHVDIQAGGDVRITGKLGAHSTVQAGGKTEVGEYEKPAPACSPSPGL